MGHNKRLSIVLLTAVFLFSASTLCAQEPGYYVDFSNSRMRIFQRFVWDAEEFAVNYEVIIQVYNNGYREYLRTATDQHYIDVNLPPGHYRYSVTPRDLLNRRGDASEWKEFEVIAAFQPQVEKFIPEVFYLDREQERVLDITGVNLLEESEIYLYSSKGALYPVKVDIIGGGTARVVFDDETLVEGEYDIYVVNPGGFETKASGFSITYRKPLDIFIKIAYTPVLPIYGELYDIFGLNLFLPGLTLSLESISTKRSTFNGGIELASSFYIINPSMSIKTGASGSLDSHGNTDTSAAAASVDLNIALQKRFNHGRAAVTFRFGLGAAFMLDYGDYTEDVAAIHFNLGISGLFLIGKTIYFETGADYVHNIVNSSGLLKPRIGIVFRL